MRLIALAVALIAIVAPTFAQKRPPNIILVTMDTVRADRMGFLGSRSKLTPNLDAVAAASEVFTAAYSQAPITPVSHATILSGTYPQFHGVSDFGKPLPAEVPFLPAVLKAHGYTTAAFVGSVILDPKNGLAPGFDRGFDVYDAGYRVRKSPKESRYGVVERRAFDVVDRAAAWLKTKERGPYFLWIHLFDAHDPYEPPAPYASKASKYDGEVAYVDAAIGRLIRVLKQRQEYASSALLVTADHGESLGAHGERTHGLFLYDETMRVPLLLKLPGITAAKRKKQRVELVDITPTLLKLANAPAPAEMQGKSLLEGSTEADSPAYSETHYPSRAFGWSSLAAIRSDKYLFVRAPRRELYDLSQDPAETNNIAAKSTAVADVMSARLDELRAKTSADRKSVSGARSAEQAQQLAALGYASGSDREQAPGAPTGIDPKDKVEIANDLHDAIVAVEDGRYAEAQPLLTDIVRDQPQIYTAQYQLGLVYAKQKQFAAAIPHLRKAVEIQPDAAIAHYELGLALFETGDLKGAAPEFETVTEKMPKWADAQFSLGSVYARTDRLRDALDRLQLAIESNPDHFQANLLAGRILSLQGRPDVGVALLEKAVQVQGDNAEAHAFLADAYRRLGRTSDAEQHERLSRGSSPGRPK
jgi:choline-sulfatase